MPRLFFLTRLFIPALAASLSAQTATSRAATVPLLDCSGLPCLDVATASGQNLRMLLDLGTRNAYLDSAVAAKLGIHPSGNAAVDAPAVRQAFLPGAHLGDLPLGDVPVMLMDLTPDESIPGKKVHAQRIPADGALTYGTFQNRTVELNLAKHTLAVSEPLVDPPSCDPPACADLIQKHFGQFGPVTITSKAFALNGEPLTAQFDLLFGGTVLVYPRAAERLGLKKLSKSKQTEDFPYTQDGLRLARAQGAALLFAGTTLSDSGPVYFWTDKTESPGATQFDATVGLAALKNVVVLFDFKGLHVSVLPSAP